MILHPAFFYIVVGLGTSLVKLHKMGDKSENIRQNAHQTYMTRRRTTVKKETPKSVQERRSQQLKKELDEQDFVPMQTK